MQSETTKPSRRIPWGPIIGAVLLLALTLLVVQNWAEVRKAFALMREARPVWLSLAFGCVAAGFVCAGQVYGRALQALKHSASVWWLTAAAMVTILVNQAVPAGSVAAYAFLVSSLRRRGFPVGSVTMVAGLELISWNIGVIVAFSYGLLYLLATTGLSGASVSYTALAAALGVLGSVTYVATRPDDTLHDWSLRVKWVVNRLFRQVIWTSAQVRQVVDEILASRRMILEQPGRMVVLVLLQLTVFTCHSLALDFILRALGVPAPVLAVMAAYGLALIVSVFTLLPGGGGTVEAALTVALVAQGVPPPAALGAAIVFRLISFWMLLPLGAIAYRSLTRSRG
jgi:uncharacterized protein (TIRG00374 family)